MLFGNGTHRRALHWISALSLLAAAIIVPRTPFTTVQDSRFGTVQDSGFAAVQDSGFAAVQDNRFAKVQDSGFAPTPARRAKVAAPVVQNTQKTVQESSRFGRLAQPPSRSPFSFQPTPATPKADLFTQVCDVVEVCEAESEEIKKELNDIFWNSTEAKQRLLNCTKKGVEVEVRYATAPRELVDKILGNKQHAESTGEIEWNFDELKIPVEKYDSLVEQVTQSDDAIITAAVSRKISLSDPVPQRIEVYRPQAMVKGLEYFSMLAPENARVLTDDINEGVEVFVSVNRAFKDTLEGKLTISSLIDTDHVTLPLDIAERKIEIEFPDLQSRSLECSWDLPDGQVQVVRATHERLPESETVVVVKATKTPPLVTAKERLLLSQILAIKADLAADPSKVMDVAEPETDVAKSSRPLSLLLRCGDSMEDPLLETKIGLTNDTTLTVRGDVDSQQISKTSVLIQGQKIVFENKSNGSFKAAADRGSVSFQREQSIEDSLQLSLESNASLEFAGITFQADSIMTFPGRIEANGNVRISIPKIGSSITTKSVVMNLKSLTFDFDGAASMERSVKGESFPIVVKSNHLAWSLITGEMQTNIRHNQRAGGANRVSSFGTNRAATRFGQGINASTRGIPQSPGSQARASRFSRFSQ